ncbi:MAG TPA: ATP-dependent 6-phosphofructokinase [Nitrososphaerales archaeon]|nr:ATP-dependent 6-phosphofructokinase [Nitrososphaerales archaeon]
MKVGVLTGGGDCAGINAVIRAVVRRAEDYGVQVVGIRRGWAGLMQPDLVPLNYDQVADIISVGGTILLTSRTNPFKKEGGPQLVMKNFRDGGLDALVAIGGEDTLGVAHKLAQLGLKAVGVPKTIDNDLSETDVTFGFDSAVNVAVDAIDRIRTTGMSHERVMVVEVMGRDAGWIATQAGIAAGAHVILVPEEEFDLEAVCESVAARRKAGKNFTLIVAAEGARVKLKHGQVTADQDVDQFGHPKLGGIGHLLAAEIEKATHLETRDVVLGHILRGGSPLAFDRVLSTRLGVSAMDLVMKGKFDRMVALRGNAIVDVGIEDAIKPKVLDSDLLSVGRLFS